MPDTSRLLTTEKYWLKRARVCLAMISGTLPELAATAADECSVLADLRIEEGRIRAILPAGSAPCCSRGVDLDGACVVPLKAGGALCAGGPADLVIDHGPGRRVVLRGGAIMAEGCEVDIVCCCIPAAR